jgi:hypothetical protein
MIGHGRDMGFARVVAVGGKHIDDKAADDLACMRGEARRQRLSVGACQLAQPVTSARVGAPSFDDGEPAKGGASVAGAGGAGGAGGADAERRAGGLGPGFSGEVRQQQPVPVVPEGANVTELLETLTDEVQMCVRYYASQFPQRKVERVVFVGGEARHAGLCQHVARALRLPAQMADPMARVARSGNEPASGIDLKNPQPGWAVALGLCVSPTDL